MRLDCGWRLRIHAQVRACGCMHTSRGTHNRATRCGMPEGPLLHDRIPHACPQVFMVSADAELNVATLKNILASGHSRVPVHAASNRQASPPPSGMAQQHCPGCLISQG